MASIGGGGFPIECRAISSPSDQVETIPLLIAWMVFPPAEQSNMLSALTGALGAGYLQVINYWFSKPKES